MHARELSQMLAAQAAQVAEYLLPGGKKKGQEWKAGSVAGEAGDSLSRGSRSLRVVRQECGPQRACRALYLGYLPLRRLYAAVGSLVKLGCHQEAGLDSQEESPKLAREQWNTAPAREPLMPSMLS